MRTSARLRTSRLAIKYRLASDHGPNLNLVGAAEYSEQDEYCLLLASYPAEMDRAEASFSPDRHNHKETVSTADMAVSI